ncbi:MAG TPA: hypothetical protein VGB03_07350 [Acidimicrobiales bacterium]|jgi:hypothetical protein
MKRALAGVVAMIALVGSACGGGSNNAADEPSTTSTTARPAPTEAEAKAALLAPSDVPTGWKAEASSDEEEDDEPCPEFTTLNAHKAVAEASVEFSPGEVGPFVEHEVLLYADVAGAERYMTLAEQAVAACKSFTDNDPDLGKLTGSFTAAASPGLGDASLAATMSGKGTGIAMSGDIIAVRKGRAISLVSQVAVQVGKAGSKLQANLTKELAAKATAKLQAVA